MSEISNLSDLYIDELKDLWSANDQMARALKKVAPQATHQNSRRCSDPRKKGLPTTPTCPKR